ncbi:substrate-binding domain-containing protein [Streptomyces sp. NPDC057617]|uniref:substrate-binding domain-containing protein n=1 Tax=Streptomyces sp. NPDC057617 TaxID=3346184 RepID=UPI0036B6BF64
MNEWLTADNILATIFAVFGLAASAVTIWYRPRAQNRKRIGYRVQMDTPFGNSNDGGDEGALTTVRIGAFGNFLEGLDDATVVLIRIENNGAETIAESDYTSRDALHGLTVVFSDRTVRGVAVTQPEVNDEYLLEHFVPAGPAGLHSSGRKIFLPPVPLNRNQHFKLLVLLTGGPVNSGVRITGGLQGGDVVRNKGVSIDEELPLFSRQAKWITAALSLSVSVLAVTIAWPQAVVPPRGCETGKLTVVGSTAFNQAAKALKAAYEKDCPGSEIDLRMTGTTDGLEALVSAGKQAEGRSPAVIAFSDGLRTDADRYRELEENYVAISTFALVANSSAGLPEQGLTREQVRQIFTGKLTDWSQAGGGPGAIKLVTREGDSGTQEIFERKILMGAQTVADNSVDCETLKAADKNDPIIHCKQDSTDEMLNAVADTEGALGYSELNSFEKFPDKKTMGVLSLDGQEPPSTNDIATSTYLFTEVEYAYTYGNPSTGSLTRSFLNFVTLESGQSIIEQAGHAPCERAEMREEMQERCQQEKDEQLAARG